MAAEARPDAGDRCEARHIWAHAVQLADSFAHLILLLQSWSDFGSGAWRG